MPTPVSCFINLREAEAEREQLVLLAHRPGTRKTKALAQPHSRLPASEPGMAGNGLNITAGRGPQSGADRWRQTRG